MKQINKTFLPHLKEFFDFSTKAELMKNLKVFKCKRNFRSEFLSDKLNKDELYYVIFKSNFYQVLLDNSLFPLSDQKRSYCYFYNYFMTESEMRKAKLIKLQQVSKSNL
jgi:hypothetical protein